MRWVPKCRKARTCALEVRSTISGAHSTKAYAASTGASSGYDMSAAAEPTAVKTAAAKVAAAASSTTKSTAMEAASASSTTAAAAAAASHHLTHCGKQNYAN
jgi:hypothetical protein